jgi:hypothetical protein
MSTPFPIPSGLPGVLRDFGYDPSDIGTGNDSFNAQWIGRETGVSSREAAEAGHYARDDMQQEGWLPPSRHGG